jgi:hypothetical protein
MHRFAQKKQRFYQTFVLYSPHKHLIISVLFGAQLGAFSVFNM